MKKFSYGSGHILVDSENGAVKSVRRAGRPFLLGHDEREWHHSTHDWGKGFGIINETPVYWDHPSAIRFHRNSVQLAYSLADFCQLKVRRSFGVKWSESYQWHNSSSKIISISCLGIYTPWRDVYTSAADSLTRACHAHIWPGGEMAWVWAVPMSGDSPGVGLRVVKGDIWAYSIENRNIFSSSNIRGNIVLHPTDFARNPSAFGGQPVIRISPGKTYELSWELAWHSKFSDFKKKLKPAGFHIPKLAVQIGHPLAVKAPAKTKISAQSKDVSIEQKEEGFILVSKKEGERYIDIQTPEGKTRVAVLFHAPLRKLVERRIDYILRYQRATGRGEGRSGALLPIDATTRLRICFGAWKDWSDARERVGMALLLQHARMRIWHHAATLDKAIADYNQFIRRHLLTAKNEVKEDSFHSSIERLYNYPFFAEFYLNQYSLYGRKSDLERCASVVEAYYRNGGEKHLAFWESAAGLVQALAKIDSKRSAGLRKQILNHAETYRQLGIQLPRHEVNYEHSMVAPLLMLYLKAYQLDDRKSRWIEPIERTMRWLEVFASEQPHVRLRHMAIRHWDGFWFGRERLWGDVFPHYWTVLSAFAFEWYAGMFPSSKKRKACMAKSEAIYLGNLIHFYEDGSATCAYVMPSCIDHRPAHRPDPCVNDQDWALVWQLKKRPFPAF